MQIMSPYWLDWFQGVPEGARRATEARPEIAGVNCLGNCHFHLLLFLLRFLASSIR